MTGEKTLYNMIGVITAMNTPFDENNEVDYEGFEKHVRYAIDAGVAGLITPCVAGEFNMLTPDERIGLLRTAVRVADGRVPVLSGATADTLDETLAFVRELTDAGADGVMVNVPYDNDDQYRDYIRAIDAEHPRMLMVQEYDLNGPGVRPELIAEMFEEVPSFRCLKLELALSGPKYTTMLELTGGRLHISGGWGITQYIEALDRGVHGMVPTGLHEGFCTLDRLYREGYRDKARAIFARLQPIAVFANQTGILSQYFYKRLLWRQGYYKTPNIRTQGIAYDRYYQRIADEMIDDYEVLVRDIKAGMYD